VNEEERLMADQLSVGMVREKGVDIPGNPPGKDGKARVE